MPNRRELPRLVFTTKLLLISILIGILAGLGSVLFFYLLKITTELFLGLAGYSPPDPAGEAISIIHPEPLTKNEFLRDLLLVFIPAFGGLISGYISYKLAPTTVGDGTDAAIRAIHHRSARISPSVPPLKAITSSILIGAGGSAGREGPISQIGAGIASFIATRFRLSDREREILSIAGLAAGIGSIFKSPLGGSIFGIEVLYKRDYEVEALVPAVISTFVAYIVYCLVLGWSNIFETPQYSFHPSQLAFFTILGIIAGLLARAYIGIYRRTQHKFNSWRIPLFLKTTLAGLIVGIIGVFVPPALETGYGWIQLAIWGRITVELLFLALFAKIISTSLTVGSGGSGGLFAPSLVIGGFLGGAFAYILYIILPPPLIEYIGPIGIYILIGMGCFFAAAAKVPLASIIMVAEMTGDYNVLPAAFLASILAYLISGEESIYEQLDTRYISPIHEGEIIAGLLESLKVGRIATPDVTIIRDDATIREAEGIFIKSHRLALPVVNAEGRFIGIVTLEDILSIPPEEWDIRRIHDIVRCKFMFVHPDNSLLTALYKILTHEIPEIPVVDRRTGGLIGEVSFRDIMKYLHYRVEEYFRKLRYRYLEK